MSARLGSGLVEVATQAGVVLARHRRAPDGAGALERADAHVAALERAVLAGFSDRAACRPKTRRPPSPAARAEAARLRGDPAPALDPGQVIDFAAYAAADPPDHRYRRERGRGDLVNPETGTAGTAGATAAATEAAQPRSGAEAALYQRLREHLAYLRLPDAAAALPTVLDDARTQQLSALATVERLLAVEVDATEARRLASRTHFACLPAGYSLTDYDGAAVDRYDPTGDVAHQALRYEAAEVARSLSAEPPSRRCTRWPPPCESWRRWTRSAANSGSTSPANDRHGTAAALMLLTAAERGGAEPGATRPGAKLEPPWSFNCAEPTRTGVNDTT